MKEIIDKNIVVPRSDLAFYIDQILAYGKLELGAKFIQKASSWYPYSRTLEKAKEIIQEKTKGKWGNFMEPGVLGDYQIMLAKHAHWNLVFFKIERNF